MTHTKDDLIIMQGLSLDIKIAMTISRIRDWYNNYNGQVYISFSGGKDSTVLLHIARSFYPDIPAVFCDTGLEYPEIRDFVKTFDNVTWLKPKMRFDEVIEKFGYPIISKEIAGRIYGARKGQKSCVKSFNKDLKDKYGNPSRYSYEKWSYLLDAPFKISDYCCQIMKKTPFHKYEKQSGNAPILGTLAEESRLRRTQWLKYGCNAFDLKRPVSQPLSFWTEQDILKYLKEKEVPYCSVYGKIVTRNGELTTTGLDRTGCMFCMFGCHLEKAPNRFQQMAITHPKQYKYCIENLGIGKVLDFIGVDYQPLAQQGDLFDKLNGGEKK